jgi:cytochrome c-type biogenesis protein CcmH/NrfF
VNTDDTDIKILGVLMVYGPCQNLLLAQKSAMIAHDCYRRIYDLRKAGLAQRIGPKAYKITSFGEFVLRARQPGLFKCTAVSALVRGQK